MFKFNKVLATFVFCAATQGAAGALAAQPDNGSEAPMQIVVPYGDLDLGSAAGAHTLRVRLDAALAKVEGPVDVRDLSAEARCARAHREAMAMVDAVIAAQRMNIAYAGPLRVNVG
jgi:UrcA family protein